MTKTKKATRKKTYRDTYRYVFLCLHAKDLDPEEITKKLNIKPDFAFKRGILKDKNGNIKRHKNGSPIKMAYGQWILNAHVHKNSGLETRIKNIVKQIKPKRKALQQIVKKINADLTIAVEPHRDLYIAGYLFSGKLLNEFTSLGIDIDVSIHIPEKMEEFFKEHKLKRK